MQIGYPNNEAVTSMFVRVVRFTGHHTPKKMPGLRPASPPLDQSLPQVFHMQVKLNPKLIRLLWRFAGSVRHSDQDLPGVVSSAACIPTSVVPSLPAAIPASPLIGFVPSSWRSCPPGFQVPQQSSSSAFLRRAGAALPVLPAGCDRPLFSRRLASFLSSHPGCKVLAFGLVQLLGRSSKVVRGSEARKASWRRLAPFPFASLQLHGVKSQQPNLPQTCLCAPLVSRAGG